MILTPMLEFEIPENAKLGSFKVIWLDNDYVYKAYRKMDYGLLSRSLNILNTLPEYETEQIVGAVKNTQMFVTKLKKLMDWQDILATYYFTEHKRLEDWLDITKQYVTDIGFVNQDKYYMRNGVMISGLSFYNIGMDENNNLKIIDAKVYGLH